MDPAVLKLLIGAGNSPQLSQIDQQIKLAQALQARPNAPPVLNPGGRTVPNFGGAFSDAVRQVSTGQDLNALRGQQTELTGQALQAADQSNKVAADQFAAPGGVINDLDGGTPTAITAGGVNPPSAQQDLGTMRAFTGLQDPLTTQKALAKMMLERNNVPYGGVQVDALGRETAKNARYPGSSTQGQTSILQVADALQAADPTLSRPDALAKGRDYVRESLSVRDIADVPTTVSSTRGVQAPASNIGTVASNAGTVKAAEAGGQVSGTTEATRFYDAPKAKVAVQSLIANNEETIKKARSVIDDPALGRITGIMAYLPSIWGGKAANAEASAESLRTALGFDRLQEMRANSPTGGALGQVSDREGEWLRNATQSLAQSQSKEQFQQKLTEIISHMQRVNTQLADAYNAEYGQVRQPGGLPGAAGRNAPVSLDDYLKSKGY